MYGAGGLSFREKLKHTLKRGTMYDGRNERHYSGTGAIFGNPCTCASALHTFHAGGVPLVAPCVVTLTHPASLSD